MIHRYFTGRHQHRGMALYGSVSFGAGGAVGSLASGYMMGWYGAGFTFGAASLAALIAGLIAWFRVEGKFVKQAMNTPPLTTDQYTC